MVDNSADLIFSSGYLPHYFAHVSNSVAEKDLVVLNNGIKAEVGIISPFGYSFIKYLLELFQG